MKENVEYVRKTLPDSVLFAQLAEEAAELAQAALKMQRILDGRNPTPVAMKEGVESLFEEIADVIGVLSALNLTSSAYVAQYSRISVKKFERWAGRLREKYGEE